MLKNALERANKAKDALERKAYKNAPPLGAAKTAGLQEQELRDQNAQLHNEVRPLICPYHSAYSDCIFLLILRLHIPKNALSTDIILCVLLGKI